MLPTSFGDQPRPGMSPPRVVGSVFTQPRETLTAAFDDRGTWDVCECEVFTFVELVEMI